MMQPIPRYEYRVFAADLFILEERMRRTATAVAYRESLEIYMVSACHEGHNVKIRDACLDIKVLLGSEGELEQWQPTLKQRFPIPAKVLAAGLPGTPGRAAPEWRRGSYSLHEFLSEISAPYSSWVPVNVFKRRYRFDLPASTAEIAQVLVNGAAVSTACVEAEGPEPVRASASALGFSDLDNVNYVTALKRVIGLAPLPEGAYYRAW